ncbi:CD59 glycoprotein [Carettochelys insculpta]|uniref:CD59 glycoprotein n=1 Tax=Carettochelys insculpta TaxID=44489 RepID=UPI003EB98B5A
MNGNKTNCILLTVFFILAVFCSSGYMLKCYKCALSAGPCKTNVTCSNDLDSCLLLKIGEQTISDCFKYATCDIAQLKEQFHVDNFNYKCCQKDLCNMSPTMMTSKAVLSITAIMTTIWILCF